MWILGWRNCCVILDNIEPQKRKKILDFFKQNFNINLTSFNDEELPIVVDSIKSIVDEELIKEREKYKMLLNEIEEKTFDVLMLLEN